MDIIADICTLQHTCGAMICVGMCIDMCIRVYATCASHGGYVGDVGWPGRGMADIGNTFVILRIARVLRPLRTLTRIAGLRRLIMAFFEARVALANVAFILLIFCLLFGLIGMSLYQGTLRSRCSFVLDPPTLISQPMGLMALNVTGKYAECPDFQNELCSLNRTRDILCNDEFGRVCPDRARMLPKVQALPHSP